MENKKYKQAGDKITYAGECDVVRLSSMKWAQFEQDELIPDKKYEVISTMNMQRVYALKEGYMKEDDSGERYRYFKILNEKGDQIYVWDGFFSDTKTL